VFSIASLTGGVLPATGSGTSLASLSASANGISIARAMSRMTPRALSWWKVAICATRSRPYFSWTYLMTSSRRFMQKSTSKSGIEMRSGFRNRSNRSLNSSGSMSVMPIANATSEPAPEPRPGPTGMPCSLAQLMKSQTMRK
jgi:hypothetical protein